MNNIHLIAILLWVAHPVLGRTPEPGEESTINYLVCSAVCVACPVPIPEQGGEYIMLDQHTPHNLMDFSKLSACNAPLLGSTSERVLESFPTFLYRGSSLITFILSEEPMVYFSGFV